MPKVVIVTDSTVNLPQALIDQYAIPVMPQMLIWDSKTYRDLIDIQPLEFYQRLANSKTMPTTSQASPADFKAIYHSLLEQGCDILTILISSKLSGTCQSAEQAKLEFPGAPIEIIDSEAASLALGWQVLTTARAATAGASFADCVAVAHKARQNSGVFFVVDTLEFLHRGGRIGGGARFLGTALNLKPILELRAGRIEPIERVRTQRKAFTRLLELLSERLSGKQPIRLGILDANNHEAAQYLREQVEKIFHPEEIMQNTVNPVIGAHTGPGTVGIAFLTGF
jgi:DegV family protein with EDD domain